MQVDVQKVRTSKVGGGETSACGCVGALGGVIAGLLTIDALGGGTEAHVVFDSEGRREGEETGGRGNRFGPCPTDQDHNRKHFLFFPGLSAVSDGGRKPALGRS